MRHGMKVVLLGALCAAAIASRAPAQTTLRYKFKEGEKLNYLLEIKQKMSVSIMNMESSTKIDYSLDMDWSVISVNKDGGAQLKIKVAYAKIAMETPAALEVDSKQKEPDSDAGKKLSQLAKALASLELFGTMQPTGELKDLKFSEDTVKAMKTMAGAEKVGEMMSPDAFKSMVSNLVFPAEAVAKGKTWSTKNDAKSPFGKFITENAFTFDGPTQKDGATLEKISVKPNLKLEPDPNLPIKIDLKESKSSGQILFDNKAGRVAESSFQQTMQLQVAFQILNMDNSVTMRLKK